MIRTWKLAPVAAIAIWGGLGASAQGQYLAPLPPTGAPYPGPTPISAVTTSSAAGATSSVGGAGASSITPTGLLKPNYGASPGGSLRAATPVVYVSDAPPFGYYPTRWRPYPGSTTPGIDSLPPAPQNPPVAGPRQPVNNVVDPSLPTIPPLGDATTTKNTETPKTPDTPSSPNPPRRNMLIPGELVTFPNNDPILGKSDSGDRKEDSEQPAPALVIPPLGGVKEKDPKEREPNPSANPTARPDPKEPKGSGIELVTPLSPPEPNEKPAAKLEIPVRRPISESPLPESESWKAPKRGE